MKMFKLIDLIVQTLLLVTFVVVPLNWGNQAVVNGYFILGGGQVVSCLVHVALRYHQKKGSARNNYQRLLLLVLVIGACCFASIYGIVPFLVCLLFVSPLMALFYWWVTLSETIAIFTGETEPTETEPLYTGPSYTDPPSTKNTLQHEK